MYLSWPISAQVNFQNRVYVCKIVARKSIRFFGSSFNRQEKRRERSDDRKYACGSQASKIVSRNF